MDRYGRQKSFRERISRDFKSEKKMENNFPSTNLNHRLLALMNRMIKLYGSCSDTFVESYDGSNYWCPSYEHTRGLIWFQEQTGSLILPDVVHGLDQTGNMSLVAPLIICAILTAIWIYTLTAKENISKNIKRIAVGNASMGTTSVCCILAGCDIQLWNPPTMGANR